MSRFHCTFHGWQYHLDGSIARVLDRDDWAGCSDFGDADLHLKEVRVGTWAGWVFINMDLNAEPLSEYLAPVPQYIDPYEMDKMRYRWYVSVKVPCNWKVGVEAFNEAYHASSTHPQMMPIYGDDVTRNRIFGRHGMFYYPGNPDYPLGAPSPRLGKPAPKDFRPKIVEYFELFDRELKAFFSERDVEAVRRLMTEVDPATPPGVVMMKAMEFQREAAIAAGAGWPNITLQQMADASTDWHVFPNYVMLPWPDGVLAYRSLPHATDPDTCFFEVYALQRYAPGAEPALERKYLHGEGDWRNFKSISIILQQDFDNMGQVQRGMRSRGFKGARTNPLQEATISNFHRVLDVSMAALHRGALHRGAPHEMSQRRSESSSVRTHKTDEFILHLEYFSGRASGEFQTRHAAVIENFLHALTGSTKPLKARATVCGEPHGAIARSACTSTFLSKAMIFSRGSMRGSMS